MGIESNAHVPNNGPAHVQLMEGKDFITSDQRESLSPFCEYWVSISGANFTLPQDGDIVGTDQRSLLSTNIPFLCSRSFHM